MTQEQIKIYEICKKDLEQLKSWKTKLPFGNQNHGCGSRDHGTYFALENIHSKMHESVINALDLAIKEVNDIIENI